MENAIYEYVDNTGVNTRDFHAAIMEAIANNGEFSEDLKDIFKLVKCPEGSRAKYSLYFV